jgi:hypothetical protein
MQSKNYIIDGDDDGMMQCDFFSQLKNMLTECGAEQDHTNCSSKNNTENEDNEENCCLLTKEQLNHIHITLACGHKFNYVPLYREVIAQKTIGLSSTGYYTSHSLKRNEIKCPYCRNVQDKLLPYLNYDGVKKIFNVNHPVKLTMTSQPCMYSVNVNSKKCKKNSACKEFATEYYNGTYVCNKHYDLSITAAPVVSEISASSPASPYKCGVILRYGKNKGSPCLNPSSCRVHLNSKHALTL